MRRITPVQTRILALLSDGKPHLMKEIHEKTGQGGKVSNNVRFHICCIRKVLRPVGEDILCEIWNRQAHYRHVKILVVRDNHMKLIRPTRLAWNKSHDLVMYFFYVDEYGETIGAEQGPTDPIESVLLSHDHPELLCNPDEDETGALIRLSSGALYSTILSSTQLDLLGKLPCGLREL